MITRLGYRDVGKSNIKMLYDRYSHENRELFMAGNLGYSENDLTADLRRWWDQVADADDPFAEPSAPLGGTIFDVVPAVDSLGVVEALITIEKHINVEVPIGIIRPGGYRSFDEMIVDLLPKARALAIKQRKKEAA